jgi:hypothetical protein
VDREQRLALARRFGVLPRILGFGDGQAGSRRELAHRVGKRHLVVELDELDHVAADAAPEAVEETLLAVDVKRRRLLAMERAEPFPRHARLAQRHALLDDLHDVDVRLQVFDEVGGKERHRAYSFSSTTVTPPPPWLSGAGPKFETYGCTRRNSAIDRRSAPVP